MAVKKAAKRTPLSIFIHTEIMRWESTTIMLTASFSIASKRHVPNREELSVRYALQTPIGRTRVQDLGFVVFLHRGREESGHRVELEYRDVHSLNASDARDMAATLDAYDRASKRISERYGYAESFAASFRRMCDLLGVVEVVISRETILRTQKDIPEYAEKDDHGNIVYTAESAEYMLRELFRVCTEVQERSA